MLPPDKRTETPQGFMRIECPSIRASFLMPETWFYKNEEKGDTQAFFFTKEAIRRGSFFDTGLSVNVLSKIGRKQKMSPQTFGKNFMTTQFDMQPTSDIVTFSDGPLVVYRRHFETIPGRQAKGRTFDKKHIYVDITGNNRTDRVYVIMFESPADKWQENADTGSIMVERRTLDPTF